MPIPKLPDNIKPSSKVFTNDFEYVQLPFAALHLNWNNGNPHASQLEGAKHFGGFQRGEDAVKIDLEALNLDNLPGYFIKTDWLNDQGGEYPAYATRDLYCSPILAKIDWWEGPDRRTGQNAKNHRLDFLVYLADVENKKKLIPWGAAVLSARGYAASAIEKSFKNFMQDTQQVRKLYANGMDAMFFYANIGTFGQKRDTQKVGESTIVKCSYHSPEAWGKPDNWTEAQLESLFIGEEIAAVVCDLQLQAKEWAEDTNANRRKKRGAPTVSVQFGSTPPETIIDEGPENGPFG